MENVTTSRIYENKHGVWILLFNVMRDPETRYIHHATRDAALADARARGITHAYLDYGTTLSPL